MVWVTTSSTRVVNWEMLDASARPPTAASPITRALSATGTWIKRTLPIACTNRGQEKRVYSPSELRSHLNRRGYGDDLMITSPAHHVPRSSPITSAQTPTGNGQGEDRHQ